MLNTTLRNEIHSNIFQPQTDNVGGCGISTELLVLGSTEVSDSEVRRMVPGRKKAIIRSSVRRDGIICTTNHKQAKSHAEVLTTCTQLS